MFTLLSISQSSNNIYLRAAQKNPTFYSLTSNYLYAMYLVIRWCLLYCKFPNHLITYLRAAQKNPAESSGSRSRGVEDPNAKAGRGEEREARARSSRSVRSRSRCNNASRRDTDASHIARFRSSTCRKLSVIQYSVTHITLYFHKLLILPRNHKNSLV